MMKKLLVILGVIAVVLGEYVPIYDNDYEQCDLCMALMSHLIVPGSDFNRVLNTVCRAESDELCNHVRKADIDDLLTTTQDCGALYNCYHKLSSCVEEEFPPEC